MSNVPEYPFEKKQKMASKISDMRDKEVLLKIREIIFAENPGISATKSGGGYLMYFQNYTNITYYKIEKLLNRIEKEKLEKQTRSIVESSEQIGVLSSEDPMGEYSSNRSRLKYSNKEKRLIRRCQYEDIIHEPFTDTKNNIRDISTVSSNNSRDVVTEEEKPVQKERKKTVSTGITRQVKGKTEVENTENSTTKKTTKKTDQPTIFSKTR